MPPEADAQPTGRSRVSVVIPCYRAARFVREAVKSVLSQEDVSFEVLVVDDGSPDREELHAAVPDHPAVRILEEPHRGLAGARNAGIREASGDILAFLDADDCWLPGFLSSQIAFLGQEGVDVAYADAEFFGGTDKDGRTVMEWDPSEGAVSVESVLAGHCVPVMSTILARTEAVRAVDGFDEALPFAEDLDLWVRMLLNGATFAYRRDIVTRRRLHGANMSYDTAGMAAGQIDVIDRNLGRVENGHPLRPEIVERRRALRRSIHLAEARDAVARGESARARRALWRIVRTGGSSKHWLGVVALTVAPSLALPVLRRRMG